MHGWSSPAKTRKTLEFLGSDYDTIHPENGHRERAAAPWIPGACSRTGSPKTTQSEAEIKWRPQATQVFSRSTESCGTFSADVMCSSTSSMRCYAAALRAMPIHTIWGKLRLRVPANAAHNKRCLLCGTPLTVLRAACYAVLCMLWNTWQTDSNPACSHFEPNRLRSNTAPRLPSCAL